MAETTWPLTHKNTWTQVIWNQILMESNPLESNLAWESKVSRVLLYNMSTIKNYADLCYHNQFVRDLRHTYHCDNPV